MIQNLMFSFACIVKTSLQLHMTMMAYYVGSLYFFLINRKKIHVYNLHVYKIFAFCLWCGKVVPKLFVCIIQLLVIP